LAYAIESAINSNCFDDVVVSSDDDEIIEIAKKFGAQVPFKRPDELSSDTTTSDDVLLHAINELMKKDQKYDVLVLLDCTVPFIDKNDIIGALNLFKKNICDRVFCAIKAHPNPYFGMMEFNDDNFLVPSKIPQSDITRRQDAPIVFDVDGLFIIDVKHFLSTKKISSGKILPYEISKEHGHMIDFEFDFKVAELLMKEKI